MRRQTAALLATVGLTAGLVAYASGPATRDRAAEPVLPSPARLLLDVRRTAPHGLRLGPGAPEFRLYDDGTVFVSAAARSVPARLRSAYLRVRLTAAGVGRILDRARRLGIGGGFAGRARPDGGETVLAIRTPAGFRTTRIWPEPRETLDPAARPVSDFLDDLARVDLAYVADVESVAELEPVPSLAVAIPATGGTPLAWPGPPLGSLPLDTERIPGMSEPVRCGLLAAADLAAVRRRAGPSLDVVWRSGGRTWQVGLTPAFDGERTCEDARRRERELLSS